MRGVGGLRALVLCAALAAAPLSAKAEECTNPDALGVARTVEIDTQGGPWLGAPHGNPNLLQQGEVVLTFDDGPIPATTRPILAALAAECTKATFFMVGEMARAHPQMVREVVAHGHTVGTHTWSHRNLAGLTPERMKEQIEAAFATVEKAAGTPIAPFFRYPYLSSSRTSVSYLKGRGIAQIAIDVDSFDYLTHKPLTVVRRVMSTLEAKGRGIILMHDIHASTARAVPIVLQRLKAKGFKVVHLRPKAPVQIIEVAVAAASKTTATPQRRHRHVTAQAKGHAHTEVDTRAEAGGQNGFLVPFPWSTE
ncbi:MAG TPA: polysaccharide deacetylase family protein [Hyphomicrobiaceae bacterium]|nr:polysaccharide deacetylase family protein [Hyphomicrobiaceae bacterium]